VGFGTTSQCPPIPACARCDPWRFQTANIIVNEDDYAVSVVDFGLALVKPTDASRAIGFTDHFAAEEQVNGETLDPRADMYALGKVALYMLNGGDLDAVDDDKIPDYVPPLLADFIQTLV
jgi:serine/threonine protein kinase